MILNREDLRFHQTVSFVQIEEYRNQHRQGRFLGKRRSQSSQSLVHFDDKGQVLASKVVRPGESSQQVRCFYREDLLVKRVLLEGEQGLRREENRLYNEHKLLMEKNLLEGDNLLQRVYYHYNENLQLVGEENFDHRKIYFYNDQGRCSEEQILVKDEHLKSLMYYYDDRGNISELWEESPIGQTCRLHKYSFNSHNLIENYQLINQDGLVLCWLGYQYSNFVAEDWLECYTWRLGGRGGKPSRSAMRSCYRTPCLSCQSKTQADMAAEMQAQFCRHFQTLKLSEGSYTGQLRVGLMHGIGRLDFFDGSCYIGNFDSGSMEGYGSFYWPDGRVYRGYFVANRMEGKGNYYLQDGSLHHGTFSEGRLLDSKPHYFLDGSSHLARHNRRHTAALAQHAQAEEADLGSPDIQQHVPQPGHTAESDNRETGVPAEPIATQLATGLTQQGSQAEAHREAEQRRAQRQAEQLRLRTQQIAHAKELARQQRGQGPAASKYDQDTVRDELDFLWQNTADGKNNSAVNNSAVPLELTMPVPRAPVKGHEFPK